MDLAKTARNLAVVDIALAFARDRLAGKLPGVQPRKRRPGLKTFLIGGGVAAALGALLLKRERVLGLLPGRSEEPPPRQPSYEPPPVSNYDAPGPVANTATAVPVPPPFESPTIDEAAEEAAAAAEAANIGGSVSDYAGPAVDEPITEANRPLEEAGEGVSEGQEQAEAELAAAAEPTAPGQSPEQAQIEDAIEQADNPAAGERVEPLKPPDDSEWQTWSGRSSS